MKTRIIIFSMILSVTGTYAQIQNTNQPDLNIKFSYQYVISDGAIFPEEKQDILITLNFGAEDQTLISIGYNYTEKLTQVSGWRTGLIEPFSGKRYSAAVYKRIDKGGYNVTIMYFDDGNLLVLHDKKSDIKTFYTKKPMVSNVDMDNYGLD